ncbi:MAG: ICEBs1 excisionase [Eubacteriales bacterium]|nr:ICEBs1 excisionase [Eubacteriales bacterium]
MAGMYYTAMDVSKLLGVSRGHAYKIVKNLNDELQKKGFITVSGRIPKKFLAEHYYGLDMVEADKLLEA